MRLKQLFQETFDQLLQEAIDYDQQLGSIFALLGRLDGSDRAAIEFHLQEVIGALKQSNLRSDAKQWILTYAKGGAIQLTKSVAFYSGNDPELNREIQSAQDRFIKKYPVFYKDMHQLGLSAVELIYRLEELMEIPSEKIRSYRFQNEGSIQVFLKMADEEKLKSQDIGQSMIPVGSGNGFRIFEPLNMAAACKLGTNANWCISSTTPGGNHFDRYKREKKTPYIIHIDSGDKFAVVLADYSGKVVEVQDQRNALGNTVDRQKLVIFYQKLSDLGIDPEELVNSFPFPASAFPLYPESNMLASIPLDRAIAEFFRNTRNDPDRFFMGILEFAASTDRGLNRPDMIESTRRMVSNFDGVNIVHRAINLHLNSPTSEFRRWKSPQSLDPRSESSWSLLFQEAATEYDTRPVEGALFDLALSMLNFVAEFY